ncbi:hypothetical protein D3C81_1840440 [compost metagenome]
MGDGIDVGKPLEPLGHGFHRHIGIGQKGQGEQNDHGHPLYAGGRPGNYTEEGEYPADGPGAADDQKPGKRNMLNASHRTVAHQITHDEGQDGGNGVTDRIRQKSSRQRRNTGNRQGLEAVEHAFVHVLP